MKQYRQIGLAILIAATASQIGCTSDEERARTVLNANAAGILECYNIYEKQRDALAATFDAMQRGEWTSARQQIKTDVRPATIVLVECTDVESAILANKLNEARIPDDVAAQVLDAWWREKMQDLNAAREARAAREPAQP